jgi:hypothetical protein
MKKLILLLFIVNSFAALAQLGVKLSNIRPTGSLGAGVKPTIGGELFYKANNGDDENETGFSVRFSIGYTKFTPRKDTFPTYGVISGSGTTVTPGYTVIHKYNMAHISIGTDYMIGITDKLFLYPGIDVSVLFTSLDYESYTPLISSEGYSGGYAFIGTRFRLGAEYPVTEMITAFTEVNRSMNFSPEVGGLAYNDYGLGIRINF